MHRPRERHAEVIQLSNNSLQKSKATFLRLDTTRSCLPASSCPRAGLGCCVLPSGLVSQLVSSLVSQPFFHLVFVLGCSSLSPVLSQLVSFVFLLLVSTFSILCCPGHLSDGLGLILRTVWGLRLRRSNFDWVLEMHGKNN